MERASDAVPVGLLRVMDFRVCEERIYVNMCAHMEHVFCYKNPNELLIIYSGGIRYTYRYAPLICGVLQCVYELYCERPRDISQHTEHKTCFLVNQNCGNSNVSFARVSHKHLQSVDFFWNYPINAVTGHAIKQFWTFDIIIT